MSLSRRALLLITLIILLAIIGIWNNQLLAEFWLVPAVIMLLLMVWEGTQLRSEYTIERTIPSHLALGEVTHYRQSISNHGNRLLSLDCQADYPNSLSAENAIERWTIPTATCQHKEINVTPVTLGSSSLGQLYIRVLGKFGLVWWSHKFADNVIFKVEPATLNNKQSLFGEVRSGERKNRYKPGSGFELLSLRDYQYGDSQRSIDWKASARRNKPIVRLFSQEHRLEIAILIDCGRSSFLQYGFMDRLHHTINTASRLADFAVRHDDHVACIAYASNIIASVPMSGGISSVKNTRQLLSNLKVIAEESNPLTVALELKKYLRRRSLVIFLTDIEQAEVSSQLLQTVHLLGRKHHLLFACIDDPNIAELTHQTGQHWLAPYENLAALEYIRGRQLTINKLTHAGVSVISAPVEKLDREVLHYYQHLRELREV